MSAEFCSLLRSPLTVRCGEVTWNLFVSPAALQRQQYPITKALWEKHYRISTKCFELLVYFTTFDGAKYCPSSQSVILGQKAVRSGKASRRADRGGVGGGYCSLWPCSERGKGQDWGSYKPLPPSPVPDIQASSHYFVHLRVHVFFPRLLIPYCSSK